MGHWELGIGNWALGNWALGMGNGELVICYWLFVICYLLFGLLASLLSITERFNIRLHDYANVARNLVNLPIPPPNF